MSLTQGKTNTIGSSCNERDKKTLVGKKHTYRLTKAVELLVACYSVKQVAFAIGYSQPSAFVEAFRRTFGVTPKVWTDYVRNASTSQSLKDFEARIGIREPARAHIRLTRGSRR